jgi:YHS domain-containing protein
MLTSLIAFTLLGAAPADGLKCPVMGSNAPAAGSATDYNGVRYRYCCGGCEGMFKEDPAKALKSERVKGLTLGAALFDPVSGKRVTLTNAKGGTSDYHGVRFHFLNAGNKSKFEADPKKYGTMPEKEAMYCPVLKIEMKNYYGANSFVDHEGVRYYLCCDGCYGSMKSNATAFVGNASRYVKSPKALSVSAELAKASGM